MRVGILQPGYFPWLGFFEQLYASDVFVIFDSVKYSKGSWRNRNRIRVDCPAGWKWITVPVEKEAENKIIRDVRIGGDSQWRARHLNMIQNSYGKSKHYEDYMPAFAKILESEWTFLADLDMRILETTLEILGKPPAQIVKSSEMDLPAGLEKTEKLVDICVRLGADELYDGAAAEDFIERELFDAAGINVRFQNYKHPQYPQAREPFVPYLSVLDLIMNCGPDSLEILMGEKYEQYIRRLKAME
ncbi:MAG TPA: WbqC family protein [bacterium]|nr:WbqC family protein [bacterium]HPI77837.1 WbqC family protein [bacterium]